MFLIPIAIAAVGAVTSTIGQIKAGNAAKSAAEQNAANTLEAAQIREDQQRQADTRTLATGRSIVGASGVQLQGSPLDVLAESARQAELNALIIRRSGILQAQADIAQGKAAQSQSRYGAAGTLLTYGSEVANLIPKSKKSPAPTTLSVQRTYDPNTGLMY